MSSVIEMPLPRGITEALTSYQHAAIDILLAMPDAITDPLESELYMLRDRINGCPEPTPEEFMPMAKIDNIVSKILEIIKPDLDHIRNECEAIRETLENFGTGNSG